MKIVILDGYAENPGDLSWDGLRYGEKGMGIKNDAAQMITNAIRDVQPDAAV